MPMFINLHNDLTVHLKKRLALLNAMKPLDDTARTVKYARLNELEQLIDAVRLEYVKNTTPTKS